MKSNRNRLIKNVLNANFERTLYVAYSCLLLLMWISDRYSKEDHYILDVVPMDPNVTDYKIKM